MAVVMAAGKGTRMRTDLPKVLVPVRGRPMIDYVLDALQTANLEQVIVVVGHRADDVRSHLSGRKGIAFALQTEQLGTGHAVMSCRPMLQGHDGAVLVVAGDSPLMQASSVNALLADYQRQAAACILGTARRDDPTGLGRIVRDAAGNFRAIVEQRDATEEQQRITEVNMSYYVFDCGELLWALGLLRANNSQREYYITDCPGLMVAHGKPVRALNVLKPFEALGINTLQELQGVEAAMDELGYGL